MIKNQKILLGKAEETEVYLDPKQMNRHGFIAGASGTGKTVTLKVIAESLSELGVPTVIADVKGDLSGMIVPGDKSQIQADLILWESLKSLNAGSIRFISSTSMEPMAIRYGQ